MNSNPALLTVVGPISTVLDNLIYLCEVILGRVQDYGGQDPALVPLPWRTSISEGSHALCPPGISCDWCC